MEDLRVIGMGIVGLIFTIAGIYLLWLRHQVEIGKKSTEEGTFKALSRYPFADWGEHWKNKGDPSMVTLIGVFLLLTGLYQLAISLAYALQFFFGIDLGFPD